MARKKLAPNSFQELIVNFLSENPSENFTAKEILDEINKVSERSRSRGSMSGTIAALLEDGWIKKVNNEHPSRYFFNDQKEVDSDTTSHNISRDLLIPLQDKTSSSKQESKDMALKDKINQQIKEAEIEFSSINNRIENLQQEKEFLARHLDRLKALLS